jgi:uncharacterized membrane protein YgdD (TMEM256/DUF423 family)
MEQTFLILGGILGGLGVSLGAFGAHALKARLTPERLETFETGVRYQMYHALALVLTALVIAQSPAASLPPLAGWLFLVGTILFSGSLYLLVISRRRWLGAITPLGGIAFIAGWVCLALSALQGR